MAYVTTAVAEPAEPFGLRSLRPLRLAQAAADFLAAKSVANSFTTASSSPFS
jgi:hypothetical protein